MRQTIEEIKTFIPIAQAIENYTGDIFTKNKMCCPLHNEKTASFTVYPANNTFYCFGCGASGSLIDFVKLYFNFPFKEAVMKIACDFGILHAQTEEEQRIRLAITRKRIFEREEKIRQAQARKVSYWRAFDRVLLYESYLKDFRPLSVADDPHPLFIEALQNINYARYLLECAENERNKSN